MPLSSGCLLDSNDSLASQKMDAGPYIAWSTAKSKSMRNVEVPTGNVWYDQMFYITKQAQALGILVVEKNENGDFQSKCLSFTFIYSVLLSIVRFVGIYFLFDARLKNISGKQMTFLDCANFWATWFFLSSQITPVFSILERKKLCKYYESWKEFEMEYFHVVGKAISFNLKFSQLVMFVIMNVMLCGYMYLVHTNVMKLLYVNDIPTYALVLGYIIYTFNGFMLGLYTVVWYFFTYSNVLVGKSLVLEFRKARHNSFKVIEEYHSLWISLKHLCESLGSAFAASFSFLLFYIFVSDILNIYLTTKLIGSGYSTLSIALRYAYSVLVFGFMSLIGGFAYRAVDQVGYRFKRMLFRLAAEEADAVVRDKLRWFAESVALNEPSISLAGFVTLNRSLNVSICGSLVTYLSILLQIHA